MRDVVERTEVQGNGWRPKRKHTLPPSVALHADAPGFTQWQPSLAARILILANVMTASFYAVWWFTPGHTGVPTLFVLLAVAEGFTFVHHLGLWWAIWATKVTPPPPSRTTFSIDVFIPTRGEPLDVLRRTVQAAVAMDLAHETFVLDDASRPEVQQLAERLGAKYMARDPHNQQGAKAGNLNFGLRHAHSELIAIFDADHVPRRDFLTRLVGYFEDPDLAFVQTPQYYANSDRNRVARGAYQQQAIFYGPICRGKNGLQSAFCCGTNVLFRRQALIEVGGFNEKSVVEDFVTSMRIHRRGWGSVYYPYVLAVGMGPSNLRTYFSQQFRWARGSVGALFSLEPFKPGFTLAQRVQYLMATTFYMIGGITAIYIILPLLYLFFGWSAFSASSATFVFFYVPYLVLALITVRWGLGGRFRLEHLQYTFGAFPVYLVASLAALLHIPARFRVTSKQESHSGDRSPVLAWVPVAASVVTVVAIVVGLFLRPTGPRTFTNIAWAIINLLLLSAIVVMVFRETFSRRAAPSEQAVGFTRGGRAYAPISGGAVDVEPSEGGMDLLTDRRLILPEHAVAQAQPTEAFRNRVGGHWAAIVAISAIALIVRVALIDVQSLRLDESLSLGQVQEHSLVGLWRYLAEANVHVPLYHTLLFFWVRLFGSAEWVIRIPSVILGAASVPMLYLVARRLMSHRAALFAAAIGATSPFWIWHADEARMYPLMLFLALSSLYLLLRALEDGGAWRWVAYGVVTGISFYSHYFALLMPAVHLGYLLIYRVPWRKFLAWVASVSLAGVLFLPWMWMLYTLRLEQSGLGSLTSGVRLAKPSYTLFGVLYGFLFFLLVYVLGYGQALGNGVGILGTLSAMVAGSWPLVALFGTIGKRIGVVLRSRMLWFLLWWMVTTVGLVYLLSVWKPGLWIQRYLIIASPALFLLIGAGLGSLFRKRVAIGIVLVMASFGTLAITENFSLGNPVREDFRSAWNIIQSQDRPGDVVIVMPLFYRTPMRYYVQDRLPVIGLLDSSLTPRQVIDIALPPIEVQHEGFTMWVVLPYESVFDPARVLRRGLDRQLVKTGRYRLGGNMEMLSYRIPTGS
jgi:cellulose synthase (UDP-forming)